MARGEPFTRGFRLIDAGLEENPYFICHNAVGVSFMPFYNYSEQILPNLCKGVARSKGFLILLAYAREILGIIAEDFG